MCNTETVSPNEWRKSQKMIGFGCNVDALIDACSWECENMDEEWLASDEMLHRPTYPIDNILGGGSMPSRVKGMLYQSFWGLKD